MTTDFRAILQNLINAEGDLVTPYDDCGPVWHELIKEARAALAAEPEPAPEGGPSDEELDGHFFVHCSLDDYGNEYVYVDQFREAARGVLASYGTPAPLPVAEPSPETLTIPADRLPDLRGAFERILCVSRSIPARKPVGNIELADRLIRSLKAFAAEQA